jgi:hypothetical protein
LSRRLGVERGTISEWVYGGDIPVNRLEQLIALCRSDIGDLLQVITVLEGLLAKKRARPKRRHGMYVVRDWGDGLPPHNKVSGWWRRFGLEGPPTSLCANQRDE